MQTHGVDNSAVFCYIIDCIYTKRIHVGRCGMTNISYAKIKDKMKYRGFPPNDLIEVGWKLKYIIRLLKKDAFYCLYRGKICKLESCKPQYIIDDVEENHGN